MTADPADAAEVPAWTRSWWKRGQIACIAGLATPLLKALCATLKVEVVGAEHMPAEAAGRPYIVALWHGRIVHGMCHWHDRGIVVVTSENFDGEWIARIIKRFGFGAARGSSSRGGARALRELKRLIDTTPAAFTVDGPRGPARVVQPGVAWLSKVTGLAVIPFHGEAERAWTLRSWDRTQIPKPFSRVVMSVGAPVPVPAAADAAGLEQARLAIEQALVDAEAACRRALEGRGAR